MNREMRKFYRKLNKTKNIGVIFKEFNGKIVTNTDYEDINLPQGYSIIDGKIFNGSTEIGEMEVVDTLENKSTINVEDYDDILEDEELEEDDLEDDYEVENKKRRFSFISGLRSIRYNISNFFENFGKKKKIEFDEEIIEDEEIEEKTTKKETKPVEGKKEPKKEEVKKTKESSKEEDEEIIEDEEIEIEEKPKIRSYVRNALYGIANGVGGFFEHFGKRKKIDVDEDILEDEEKTTKKETKPVEEKKEPKKEPKKETEPVEEDFKEVAKRLGEIENLIREALSYKSKVADFSEYDKKINSYTVEFNELYGEYVSSKKLNGAKLIALRSNLTMLNKELSKLAKEEPEESKSIDDRKKVEEPEESKSIDDRKEIEELAKKVEKLIEIGENKISIIDDEEFVDNIAALSYKFHDEFISTIKGIPVNKLKEEDFEDMEPKADLSIEELKNAYNILIANIEMLIDKMDKKIASEAKTTEEPKVAKTTEELKAAKATEEPIVAKTTEEPEVAKTTEELKAAKATEEPIVEKTTKYSVDDETIEFIYENNNYNDINNKVNKLKNKLADKKFLLLALIKNGASEVEISELKAKISKIENKLAGYELKLQAYVEICGRKVEERDRREKELYYSVIFKKAEEEGRLSQLQSYSDEDISNFYESAKTNAIAADMISVLRQETPNDDLDLESMTVSQLKAYAENYKGITIPKKMKKAEIIDTIKDANEKRNQRRLSL